MNIARLERRLVVASDIVGVAAYDFDFDLHFNCEHPFRFEHEERCVVRIGPIADYPALFSEYQRMGLRLVNEPDEHARASELEHWYPVIADLTPRSAVFETLPSAQAIADGFGWPVFVKGSRQTSRHRADLSVITDAAAYERLKAAYGQDEILHWQKPVVREFVMLEAVSGFVPNQVRPSLEFRTFWWHGVCVGCGRYWYQVPEYGAPDISIGLEVAREAATRLAIPFVAIDIAKTVAGQWLVIECNDAQESGYAGVAPRNMWERILAI